MESEKRIQPAGLENDKVQYIEDEDSIIEGSEGVTQRDFDTYRHVADRLPYSAWLVLIVEFAERYFSPLFDLCLDFTGLRWTYYGTSNIFSNYIRAALPPGSTTGAVSAANRDVGIAGALGQGVQKAFAISKCAHLPRSSAHSRFDQPRYAITYRSPLIRSFDTLIVQYFLGLCYSFCRWYHRRYALGPLYNYHCFLPCLFVRQFYSFLELVLNSNRAGHIILVGSATPASLANPQVALGLLVLAIVVMGLGAG